MYRIHSVFLLLSHLLTTNQYFSTPNTQNNSCNIQNWVPTRKLFQPNTIKQRKSPHVSFVGIAPANIITDRKRTGATPCRMSRQTYPVTSRTNSNNLTLVCVLRRTKHTWNKNRGSKTSVKSIMKGVKENTVSELMGWWWSGSRRRILELLEPLVKLLEISETLLPLGLLSGRHFF